MKINKELKIGDSVKVKVGVTCPDLEALDIGGWEGIIREIEFGDDNLLILISWNENTLQNMPDYFIYQSEKEGLDHKSMYLYPEDIVKVS